MFISWTDKQGVSKIAEIVRDGDGKIIMPPCIESSGGELGCDKCASFLSCTVIKEKEK